MDHTTNDNSVCDKLKDEYHEFLRDYLGVVDLDKRIRISTKLANLTFDILHFDIATQDSSYMQFIDNLFLNR